MNNSNDDETPSIDPIKAFFGPPPPRRPIPSYSFNTLVKIFSFFSDQNQNPLSNFASSADFPEDSGRCDGNQDDPKRPTSGDVLDDPVVARGESEASGEHIVSASVEVCNPPLHSVPSNGVVAEDFSMDGSFDGLDVVMGELCQMTNDANSVDKVASDEKVHDVQKDDLKKVPEALPGIERMIMDELDDMGLSELQENDIDFTVLNDFCSNWDTEICVDNTVAAESSQTRKLAIEETIREDVAVEVKKKDVEVNRSITECHLPKSHNCLPTNRDISNQEKAKYRHTGTSLESSQNKDKKLCKEKDAKKLLESEGPTFTGQKSENRGIVSTASIVENFGKGKKSDIGSRGETAKAENVPLKDVNSGKHKHLSVNGEAFNSKRSGAADPLIQGKMVKQYARRSIRESSTKKAKKDEPESSKGIRYTREQLLSLRNVSMENGRVLKNITSVSKDIGKALQEISVEIIKGQLSSAREFTNSGGANTGKQDYTTEAKLEKEKEKENELDSSAVKTKRRGSTSEARKEKKKRLKRKKRAEMNKKLGVKRLKLRPVLKPKVVPPCRHYLNGRCQQGEACNFSHDLIPLTKSKPCCHFARNACMKGNDCPYDHLTFTYSLSLSSLIISFFISLGKKKKTTNKHSTLHTQPKLTHSLTHSLTLSLSFSCSTKRVGVTHFLILPSYLTSFFSFFFFFPLAFLSLYIPPLLLI